MNTRAKNIRLRAIEEVRAAVKAAPMDFSGTRYDETYGEVPDDGITLTDLDRLLDRLKEEPIDSKAI